MKYTWRKWLSVLLLIVMFLTLLPVSAMTVSIQAPDTVQEETLDVVHTVKNGSGGGVKL